jgi:hypothetical protein
MSSPTALAAALGTPPSQKLMHTNFLLWKTIVLPGLRIAQVLGLLNGTDGASAKTVEKSDKTRVPNPTYTAWVIRDQTVMSFIINSLSQEILAHVVGLDTTAAVWGVITSMFSPTSRAKVSHLRTALNNTKKLDTTPAVYFAKMRGFASELTAAGKIVEEDDLVSALLNGLDGTYNSLIASVNANPGTIVDDLYGQICSHDMRQDMLSETSAVESFTSSANAASCEKDRRGHADDRGSRGDRGYRGDRYEDDRREDRGRRDGDRDRGRGRDDGGHREDRGRHDEGCRDVGRRDGGRRDDVERRRDRGGGQRRRRNDGRRPTPYVDVTCQICTIHGHPSNDC